MGLWDLLCRLWGVINRIYAPLALTNYHNLRYDEENNSEQEVANDEKSYQDLLSKSQKQQHEIRELKDQCSMLQKETDFEVKKMTDQISRTQKEKDCEINELKDQIKELNQTLKDLQQTTTASFTDPQQTTTASFTDPQQTTTASFTDLQQTTTASFTDLQQTTTTSFTDPQQTTTTSSTDPQQTTTTSFKDTQQTTTTSFTDLQQTTTTSFTDLQQTTTINSSDITDDCVSSGTGSKPGSIYLTLHFACQNGNINDVKYLIDTGHDVNQLDKNNMSPILYCSLSHIEPVAKLKLILTKGGNIDDKDSVNRKVLHLACLYGILETVEFILQGIDIHSRGEHNTSPILCCSQSKIEPVAKLKLILTKGGNIDDRDNVNRNILHLACLYGILEAVEFILQQDIDIHSRGEYNTSPILCCSQSKIEPVAKLKLILTKGGNIDDRDNVNRNILHLACLSGILEAVEFILQQCIDIHSRGGDYNMSPILFCSQSKIEPVAKLKLILTKGGNIDDRDNVNRNILHLSCLYSILEAVEFILKQAIDIHSIGQCNKSPILYCSQSKIEPVAKLKLILTKGGNIDDKDNVNRNILHLACLYGIPKAVEFILQQCIDIHSRGGDYNMSPILFCSSSEIEPVAKLKLILTKGGNIDDKDNVNRNILHLACLYGIPKAVEFILQQCIDIHSRGGDYNMSPILFCSSSEIEPVAKLKLILTKGGNIDDKDNVNRNILHLACLSGILETVEFILQQRIDIHSRGDYNMSPILFCSSSKIEPVAKLKLILTKGGNIDDRDSYNNNTLHRACLDGKLETVEYLLGIGIDINSKNKNKKTPLDYCKRSSVQSEEKVKLLQAKKKKK
ncbi:serine/threonine-protein phosphatase 6 regulatory ankyrin repeat subunit A isoform X2 [Patella vulgata]|uniref:serine/threonine-protein phosphatase 6 regulatory ankyrin repeat subunit A isoform X2 n=1 Tax=Patella vulgata TaxID=6465 RepID=UPI00217FCC95|nr:serine/threonine-protein phosphatase 6 regulatory ankyrin repeat subunit A isoform X2 [Patella vulgata]